MSKVERFLDEIVRLEVRAGVRERWRKIKDRLKAIENMLKALKDDVKRQDVKSLARDFKALKSYVDELGAQIEILKKETLYAWV